MLPDFPELKAKLMEFWTRWAIRRQQQHLGDFFAEIPWFSSHEGELWEIQRVDGSASVTNYDLAHADLSLHLDEVPELTGEKLAAKFDALAEKIAKQMGQRFFTTLHEELRLAGKEIDAKGRGLDIDLILETLSQLEISFDQHGNPQMPTIVVAPAMASVLQEVLAEADRSAEHREKYQRLIEMKRDEWRARESRRKLVD